MTVTKQASMWTIEQNHLVHYTDCDKIVWESDPTPYLAQTVTEVDGKPTLALVKTAGQMIAHLDRPDTKDKMPGTPILHACSCIKLTAARESR